MDVDRVFDELFSRARDADEFEYACALLRIRGMQDAGWDPLEETEQLFNDVGSLLGIPLTDFARIRLGLLLYCHLTEVDEIYRILANMVEVTGGERCVMDPFMDLYQPQGKWRIEQRPPSAARVVRRLKERAVERDARELVELLDWFFDEQVRNGFFHSDYILYGDEFRSRDAKFIDKSGVQSPVMKLDRIVELIQRGIDFYQGFRQVYVTHRRSYREDKLVLGRFAADGSMIEVLLIADEEHGLYGFRTPSGDEPS